MLKGNQFLLALFSGLLLATTLSAQTPKSSIDETFNMLSSVRTFDGAAISPDARRVAWVEIVPGKNGGPDEGEAIYVKDLNAPDARPRRITAGDGAATYDEHSIAWSPDGNRIAFLSDRSQAGQLQLYVAPATGGAANRLTNLTGFLAKPKWSPDGKMLAVLFTENAPREAGPLQPATPVAGVVEEKIYEQRLTTIDAASGQVKQVSPADLYIHEYDWSPDGRQFISTAAPGSGDNNWYNAELYTTDVATGSTRSIYKPSGALRGLQLAAPRWSPDGKNIAFIGGLMSDEGVTGGDIYLVASTGGEARDITPNTKASPAWLAWTASSNGLLFVENVAGESGIATVDTSNHVSEVWRGPESITGDDGYFGMSIARDGKTAAVVRHSFQHAPEVWAGPAGEWRQVTHINDEFHPRWGEAKSIHWTNDGLSVQGWLVYPRNYDAHKKYPMIVSVHGGPASARRSAWPTTSFDYTILSGEDFFVFFPNPRGSYGQGEAFTAANVKDFGYGDLRDIMVGVDEIVKTLPVDNNRLGLTGWSYGGFMTMWGVTQTDRFHAAVAGAGLSNWQSYYGENGIDQWMIPYFGASVYDDPAVYARSSPITFIKKAKTPTLVLVGDRDIEVPAPQSYEFWHALKTLGVKTQFVVYPNEGHRISNIEHRRDIMQRAFRWFTENLK
jgi:dipeptidyl aminopeptidase/acylaminoacyl peptidase